MSKRTSTVSMRRITQAAQEIAKTFRVRRVILFGSYARRTAYRDSDVDFLVVAETRRPIELAGEILLLLGGRFPSDVVVRTPRELRCALRDGDSFLTGILQEGKVLHEARRSRVG